MRSRFIPVLFFALACLLPSFTGGADPVQSSPDLRHLLNRIELQRFGWYTLQAEIELSFIGADGGKGTCEGRLDYLRLGEKLTLQCFNRAGETLFIFKTDDMLFDLYLPYQNRLFRGNIFDLENSGDVESHLKPFDLYRAIRPLPLPPASTRLDSQEDGLFLFTVESKTELRRLAADFQGNVLSELFLDRSDSGPKLAIERTEFVKAGSSTGGAVYFPRRIRVQNPRTGAETRIYFRTVRLNPNPAEPQPELAIPHGTEITVFPSIRQTQTPQGR